MTTSIRYYSRRQYKGVIIMAEKMMIVESNLCLLTSSARKVSLNKIMEEKTLENSLKTRSHMKYISVISCQFYIDINGSATTDCYIYGYEGITKRVSLTASIDQYKDGKWVNFKTLRKSSNSYRISLCETISVPKGYKYRILAQIRAYSESYIEIGSLVSNEVYF